MSLLKTYQNGDYTGVWEKIRKAPNADAWNNIDIVDVAKATMERVAQNTDLISNRLREWGWEALDLGSNDLRVLPSPDDQMVFNRIAQITGEPLPLSFKVFWEIVGGINWAWNYNSDKECPDLGVDIPLDEMDPLCIEAPQSIAYQLEEWESGTHHLLTNIKEGSYRLDLAPDYLHKANISGGDAYCVILPSTEADPIFRSEPYDLHFVDYLRLSFKWAGFPRLREFKNERQVSEFVREFGQGLIEF